MVEEWKKLGDMKRGILVEIRENKGRGIRDEVIVNKQKGNLQVARGNGGE